jgi:hypothetical protein
MKSLHLAVALFALSGCVTAAPPKTWGRVDGQAVNQAQLQAANAQCRAEGAQVVAGTSAGRTTIRNTVIVGGESRSPTAGEAFSSGFGGGLRGAVAAQKEADLASTTHEGCMARLGYITRSAP